MVVVEEGGGSESCFLGGCYMRDAHYNCFGSRREQQHHQMMGGRRGWLWFFFMEGEEEEVDGG